jgi:uncharacterized iron-regulated membrane protein
MPLIPTRAFWISTHRYLGLATLGFLAIAAVTGCLLCFRGDLDAALNPDLFRASSPARRIDPIAAVAAFEAAHPDARVLSFPLRPAPGANLPVTVGPKGRQALGYDEVFLDGADGHVAGTRATQPGWDRRRLMQGVYTLHFTLLAGTVGRWFMALIALGWLIGAIVGFYLTVPRRPPFLGPWLKAWTVRIGSRLPRVMLDLHQASSLWLIAVILALATTSVCLNLFSEMFEPAVMAMSPAKPSPFDHPARPLVRPPAIGFARALDAGLARARSTGSMWRAAALSFDPALDLYGVTFTRNGLVNYGGLGPVTDYFSAADGRFVYEDSPYADSLGRKMTRVLYPIHTGQIIGPVGVGFIFVGGLQTVELCVTGLYVWWVRRPPRVAFRKLKRSSAKGAS